MGADRTLVDAAFKEAATKYGGDVINMKPMYDSNVAGMNKVFNTINSAMGMYSAKKEVGRAGVRKQMSGFQAQADALIKGMYAQDEPLPDAFVNAFRGKIESLQKKFEDVNTYGKGDTSENSIARSRIMGELQRVTNQAKNFRAGTEIALDNLKNVDPGSLDKRGISAHMQAFDFKNYEQLVEDGKIKVVYGKNGIEIISKDYDTKIDTVGTGEYTQEIGADGNVMGSEITRQVESFEGDKMIITLASFNEKFMPVDLKSHVALGEDFVNSARNATDAGSKQGAENDYNKQEYNALFTSHVDTEDKFKNFATSKIEGLHEIKQSFKVSLENELNIPVAVLSNMFLDADGDGVDDMPTILKELNLEEGDNIDAKDIAKGQGNAAFEQNLDSLIDALTNVNHPAFDIGISAPMLGAYLGKINENRYNTAFDKAKKANNKSTEVDQRNIVLGTYRSWQSQDSILDLASEGGVINAWDGSEWAPDPDKPGNYKNVTLDESYPLGNLLKSPYFGMTERISQRKLDYGSGLPNVNPPSPPPPPASSVETPNIENFAYNAGGFDGEDTSRLSNIVLDWNKQYGEMGFSFKTEEKTGTGIKDANRKYLIATVKAKNGKILNIDMGKRGGPSKENLAKTFNKFIEENKQTAETLKGLSQEEIKESVAKGEESKWNTGPDGELLSEGYTMNDLGEVVWVGVGPEPTKK